MIAGPLGQAEQWRALLLVLLALAEAAIAIRAWRHRKSDAALGWLAALLLFGSGTALWFALRSLAVALQTTMLPLYHPLALGPLVYFYGRVRLGRPATHPFLHAAPAVAALAYHLLLFLMPASAFAAWKEGPHDHLVKPALDYLILACLIGYSAAALQLGTVAPPGRSLEAAGAVRRASLLLAMCAILLSLLRLYNWFVGEVRDGEAFWVFLTLSAAPLGFWLVDRPVRAALRRQDSDLALGIGEAGRRWKRQILDAEWWRDPDLTLHEAARRLGTNASYLSRALNQGVGESFPDLVNRARAQHVARQLGAGGTAERLLDLAHEAGFSSKATFNRAFRSAFGCAPSLYVSLHGKDASAAE